MIYFLPNDWQYRADVIQKMKDEIRTVQTFYAEQMDAHGYGEVTFRFEIDSQDEPMVHRVNGKHSFSYYDNTLGSKVFSELRETYDFRANIYFIVLGTDALRQGDGTPAGGVGYNRGKNGGMALVPVGFDWGTVAHELGHTFGLGHDFRDGANIMSYGPGRNRLSACAAEFLSVHTYFNPDIPTEKREPPAIELVSPRRYPPGSTSIPVRLRVNDSEGVHQIQLFAHGGLQLCRGLNGDRNGLAEFVYDGGFSFRGVMSLSGSKRHTIFVNAVDTEGNVSDTFFTVTEELPHRIATLGGHVDAVRAVSFSRDGILASGGLDRTVRLWDIAARENIETFEGHANRVNSLAFSIDGILASGSGDGTIMLWDIAGRRRIAILEGPPWWIYSVSFSPDGKTLAGGNSEVVELWNVATKQPIAALPHGPHVLSVSFSRNGIIASGSEDRTVKLWDAATRQNFATLPHNDIVLSVTFSPDGRTLVSGGRGGIELWDVATESPLATLMHGATVASVSFAADGETLASGGWDGTVKLWDMTAREFFATFGPTSPVNTVSFSPDGSTIAAGTAEGTIELWDTSKMMEFRVEGLGEVDIPDPNLRAAIAAALGKPKSAFIGQGNMASLTELEVRSANLSDLTGLEHATNLITLELTAEYIVAENRWVNNNSVSDLSPIAGLTRLTSLTILEKDITNISATAGLTNLSSLSLWDNSISDISAVAELINLTRLALFRNKVSDISPLVENAGLGSGDRVNINGNPLSYPSIYTHIPALQERGVEVFFGNRTPHRIRIVSGNDQGGLHETALDKPFVVEVLDERGVAFEGVPVTFAVTAGDGSLSITTTTTDNHGRAESTLTLGPNPGTNTVTVSVTEIKEQRTFTAEAIRIPKTLEIKSGTDQEGLPGEALEKPFVVEVRDQKDKPLPDVEVTFSITSGDGTLSATSVVTDSSGRVESTLTLGPNPGTITVTVSVSEIQEQRTFTAEAIRVLESLEIISGTDQEGLPGEALEKPFVVEVRDQTDKPLPEVEVTFSITSGGGTLSPTSAATNSSGRAESTLTLGPNPGTNIVKVTVTGIEETQTINAIAKFPPIPQDVNQDNVVDISDLVLVASVLGNEGAHLAADVNGDGLVDLLDLVSVARAFEDVAAAPSARAHETLTTAVVRNWLADAMSLANKDAVMMRGIAVLERLLASLTPAETALLPNYPNPFNPETWIPYHLSNDADVQISIYDTKGVLVRRLELGQQIAGYYTNRTKAAYWDGKNEFGELAASGMYFYRLSAGDFFAVQTMIILK